MVFWRLVGDVIVETVAPVDNLGDDEKESFDIFLLFCVVKLKTNQ